MIAFFGGCVLNALLIADLFTNAPFAIVRADLASKIAKLRQRIAVDPGCTLEGMLRKEKEENRTKSPDAITGAMTWLLRWVGEQITGHKNPPLTVGACGLHQWDCAVTCRGKKRRCR